ncbi:sulfotransferase domain-containing protein [Tropicimonas sp. IMCC34011]|uniref:sulfotransferase domain-containing protein n=1 Tax=Tropicimonas sp. IMCC34011 TaxID=2248759 RepID=UPI000E242EAD|nr:sulfotransferase domain-containing protein [Tropicimonas sp. IMCC34011]
MTVQTNLAPESATVDTAVDLWGGHPPGPVVGLYSFPKSGNTWLRAIVAAITGMPTGPHILQRYVTDTHYGPVIASPWEFEGKHWYFYKSHRKAVLHQHRGQKFATDKVIHIHRHPLDVLMSYLNFVSENVSPNAGKSLPVRFAKVEDLTAEEMETLFSIFLEHGTLFPQNKVFGSVFSHAKAFRDAQARGEDVLILSYEGLAQNFSEEVTRIAAFLGIETCDPERVFSGADSRTKQNGKFFWKRRTGTYAEFLTEDQIGRFKARWGAEMAELGYD